MSIVRLIVAIILSGLWTIWTLFSKSFQTVWWAIPSIVSAVFQKPEVSDEIRAARLQECEKCPIFYKPLRTCGSPMMRKSWPDGEQMGCFCQMDFKSKTLSNCWLFDKTDGKMGWSRNLNSYE